MFTLSVVTFLVKESPKKELEVCLGLKKKGYYSEGKYNGLGGKIEPGEKPEEAAIREVLEESSLKIETPFLNKKGLLKYFEPDRNWIVHVFTCNQWQGKIKESNEMKPFWFKLSQLPFSKMWENDALWIEEVLTTDHKIKGTIWHDENNKIVKHELRTVDKFSS